MTRPGIRLVERQVVQRSGAEVVNNRAAMVWHGQRQTQK